MADELKKEQAAFDSDSNALGKKTVSKPVPEKNVGIDVDGTFYDNILNQAVGGQVDISSIDSLSQVSQNRDQVYQLLDTMSEDPTNAAVLETYAEDATEANEDGAIVWATSDDPNIGKYITYLLDTINVDKNVYKWTYSLVKYGDLYLRLFRESEYNDTLFEDEDEQSKENRMHLTEALNNIEAKNESEALNEDVKINVFSKNDRYAHYLEMVPNPAEMFELTRHGKSYAYIKAATTQNISKNRDAMYNQVYRYTFKKKDVEVYDATTFVHAALEDNSSRVPEEISLLRGDNDDSSTLTFNVRRGQSLLYNTFKIWRELMLLENSLLLNRLTKSSIVRVINVEVGDMPKENVGPHLMGIKQLMEQKSAINTGNSMQEYTNPGPIENNIYIPTRGGMGNISMQAIGGDVDVKGLADIDYFKNKYWSALRAPKQYFGDTDDSTGFNGGTSLSLISARYAKAVKRIQNTIIQALTDAINLMLLDKGLDSYINKFTLHMQTPVTEEEATRRDNVDSQVGIINNIMMLVDAVENPSAKLRILKIMLSKVITDPEVIDILQEQIDALEEQGVQESDDENEEDFDSEFLPSSHSEKVGNDLDLGDLGGEESGEDELDLGDLSSEESSNEEPEGEQILPTPDELGIDMTNNETEI